jgi:hypothetical protein
LETRWVRREPRHRAGMDSTGFAGSVELKVLIGVKITEGKSWKNGRMQSEDGLLVRIKIWKVVECVMMVKSSL